MFLHFKYIMTAYPSNQNNIVICFCPYKLMLNYIAFCSYVLICFYPWSYILNVRTSSTVLLIFSVLSSTYCVIYSEKCAIYLGLFCLPLIAKRCTGVEVDIFKLVRILVVKFLILGEVLLLFVIFDDTIFRCSSNIILVVKITPSCLCDDD